MAYESSLPVQIRGRRRVKEGVVRDWLRSSAGRSGEPARGWENSQAGERSWTCWGQGIQEPYCAWVAQQGPETGWSQQRGVCVCACVWRWAGDPWCEGVRGQLAVDLVPPPELQVRTVGTASPPGACNCGGLLCCPSLFTLRAA